MNAASPKREAATLASTDARPQAKASPLEARVGPFHARYRLGLEARRAEGLGTPRPSAGSFPALLESFVRWTGLRGLPAHPHGLKNIDNTLVVDGLDDRLEGFTLLHLSDLHLGHAEVSAPLVQAIQAKRADALVITGDLLFGGADGHAREASALACVQPLLEAVDAPAFAVLGDEDRLWMVPHLETMGVRVLVNESIVLTHRGARLYLAGVDDSAYYKADDVDAALQSIPTGALSILLSHSPEIYQRAAAAGFEVMLSGHTHGGQFCLPNGQPVFRACNAPRTFARGNWRYERLVGYTSSGCGGTPLGVRWNCPPEVTFHRMTRA